MDTSTIAAAKLDKAWPFTVPGGEFGCDRNAVTFKTGAVRSVYHVCGERFS